MCDESYILSAVKRKMYHRTMSWTATPSDNLHEAEPSDGFPDSSPLRMTLSVEHKLNNPHTAKVRLNYRFQWLSLKITTPLKESMLLYCIESLNMAVQTGKQTQPLDSFPKNLLSEVDIAKNEFTGDEVEIHTEAQEIYKSLHTDNFYYKQGGSERVRITTWGFIGVMLAAKSREAKWYHRPFIASAIRVWRGTFLETFRFTFHNIEGASNSSRKTYHLKFTTRQQNGSE